MGFAFWKGVLIDTCVDTLKLFPFLLVTYIFMEFLEHRTSDRAVRWLKNSGPLGPLIGALTGVVPQCGFSAAASNLYAGRIITVGTLLSVYLATSDEMLPLMLSAQIPIRTIVKILIGKVLVGFIAGILVDLLLRTVRSEGSLLGGALRGGQSDGHRQGEEHEEGHIHEICEREHCDCEKDGVFLSALKHALKITIFIFLVSFAMNALMEYRGQEVFQYVAVGWRDYVIILLTSIFGLIPNCATSVALTEMYINGMIGAGAMMSGLLVSAGVGLLVLLRVNRPIKDTLKVMAILWACGMIAGCLINVLGITFQTL